MSDPRWQAIRDLFLQALETPESEREAFVAGRCGDDAALKEDVRKLLGAHGQPDPRLSRVAQLYFTEDDIDDSDNLLGRQVGPYHVLRQIGEGGMGAVYEAEQREPVRRLVALKVVKRGMDTREVVRRFGLERQALALMSHSGIAKVFDAGVTDDGRPYFVMELAEGAPITDYCDHGCLTLRERLQLLVSLCDAIQHAHHKGVVHRDLKPSNILVGTEGGKATLKVIDFGIAKAIGAGLTEQSQHTVVGTLIGTPAYMSPEQATLGAIDVDARTDVYSLAALLYELAVGDPPFPADTLRGSDFLQALQAIRVRDAERPSVHFHKLDVQVRPVRARLRHSQPREVERELKEIDWIVMRGLAKDRADRYQTPAALAADIERCLGGLPLDAGPPSHLYRARKFAARHRVGVAISAAIAILLIAFALTMTVQSVRLEQALVAADAERSRAEGERNRAEGERARAVDVSDFLVDMLRLPDPKEGNRADMTIREVLDAAAETTPEGLNDQPRTKAAILTTVGTVYRELGVYDRAKQQLALAVDVMRRTEPRDEAELGRAIHGLGELAHDEGNFDVAEANYKEALPLLRAHPHRLTDASVALNNLAVLALDRDDPIAAEAPAREALQMRRQLFGDRHRDTRQSMSKLGRVLSRQGKWRESEKYIREALEIAPDETPDNVWRASKLAELNALVRFKGDHRASAEISRETVTIYRTALGRHQYTGIALLNLGRALTSLGRFDEAQQVLDEAWSIFEEVFGGRHQHAARVLSAQAELELVRGRTASAERKLRRAIDLCAQVFGPKHRENAANLNLLGIALREQGRLDEAVQRHLQALAIRTENLGRDHPENAAVHRALATTHIARNDLSAADAALREAMRLEANADLAGTLPASLTQGAYGWLLHLQGKDDEAMRTLAASLDVQRPALGDLHPDVGRTLVRLGEIECSNGRASAGREHLGQGLQALQTLADAARPALERAAKSLNQCNFLASR